MRYLGFEIRVVRQRPEMFQDGPVSSGSLFPCLLWKSSCSLSEWLSCKSLTRHLLNVAFMDCLQMISKCYSPVRFRKKSFRYVYNWLLEKKINHNEARFLADMVRKVDWTSHVEKEGFVELMSYLSRRSLLFGKSSWAAAVGYDST